jgi:hypothetical protein
MARCHQECDEETAKGLLWDPECAAFSPCHIRTWTKLRTQIQSLSAELS